MKHTRNIYSFTGLHVFGIFVLALFTRLIWAAILHSQALDPVTVQQPDSLAFTVLAEDLIKQIHSGKFVSGNNFIPFGHYNSIAGLWHIMSPLHPLRATLGGFIFGVLPAIRIFNILESAALVIPVMLIARHAGIVSSIMSGLIVVFTPRFIYHSTNGCAESLFHLTSAFGFYFTLKTLFPEKSTVSRYSVYTALSGFFWGLAALSRPEGFLGLFYSSVAYLLIILKKRSGSSLSIYSQLMRWALLPATGLLLIIPVQIKSSVFTSHERFPGLSSMQLLISSKITSDMDASETMTTWGRYKLTSEGFEGFKSFVDYRYPHLSEEKPLLKIPYHAISALLKNTFSASGIFQLSLAAICVIFSKSSAKYPLIFIAITGYLIIAPFTLFIPMFSTYFDSFFMSLTPLAGCGLAYIWLSKDKNPLMLLIYVLTCLWLYNSTLHFGRKIYEGALPNSNILSNCFTDLIETEKIMMCRNPWLARAADCYFMPPVSALSDNDAVDELLKNDVYYIAVDDLWNRMNNSQKPFWLDSDEFKTKFEILNTWTFDNYNLTVWKRLN